MTLCRVVSLVAQVPLLFRLEARDPLREKKAKFWRMDGPEQRRIRVCVSDNDATRSALSVLRIIVADAAEMAVVEGELFSFFSMLYVSYFSDRGTNDGRVSVRTK